MNRKDLPFCAAMVLAATCSLQSQISLSSTDTFSSTNEGWIEGLGGGGNTGLPTQDPGAGRDGFTPGHLKNTSDGSGAGGRLQMWNTSSDWTGDYIAAGVGSIDLWVDNRSVGTSLNLRIAFDGPGGWFSSNKQVIAAGSGWTNLNFELDTAHFSHIAGSGGTQSFSDTMRMASNFEIFSSNLLPSLSPNDGGQHLRGDQIMADMRIDDISALAIPEPATTAAFLGLLALSILVLRQGAKISTGIEH